MVLLDNFSLEMMREAAQNQCRQAPFSKPPATSRWKRIRGIAETGVDRISVGTLTKDVKALDLSMRFAG
jgi:nicotinate-nucleotide pyrophosphorylase (carboxylating)